MVLEVFFKRIRPPPDPSPSVQCVVSYLAEAAAPTPPLPRTAEEVSGPPKLLPAPKPKVLPPPALGREDRPR